MPTINGQRIHYNELYGRLDDRNSSLENIERELQKPQSSRVLGDLIAAKYQLQIKKSEIEQMLD